MIIKKMTAWFGTLEGRSLELGPGLNILSAPNESGKSTWCAFLRAMLYGVDTGQRAKQGQQPDKVKYLPWSGSPMSGSMDIETSDGPVTLRRWTERANQPMQAFSATVTGTDLPAGHTAEEAGQSLTGAPREVFERSAFIRQMGLGVTNDPELEKRFAAIVSAGDEEQSFSETDDRLRSWLRRRRSGRRGALPELEGELDRLGREIAQLDQAAGAVGQLEEELSRAEARQEELVRRMEEARAAARRRALAELAAAREAVQARESDLAEARRQKDAAARAVTDTPFGDMGPEEAEKTAAADMAQAEDFLRQAESLPKAWIGILALVLGALAAAAVSLLLFPYGLASVAAYVGLIVGVVLWRKSVERRREDLLDRRYEILDKYGLREPSEMEGLLEEYSRAWEELSRAERAETKAEAALEAALDRRKASEEPVLNGLDFEHGDSEAARASQAVARGQRDIEALRERRAVAEGRARAMGDPMVLRSEMDRGQTRRRELLAQESALTLAIEAMGEADAGLRERFTPMVAARAAEIFAGLTGGRYDEITLARDLSAKTRRAGDAVGREADYLSQGTKDQLYLALRLAVCDLVLPEEQACPIVLDDALAAFDQARMERALDMLKELSKKRQVLLFTCHDREREYFEGDGDVTKIEVDHV